MPSPDQVVSVGIIGCGEEVAQTVHIPILTRMSDRFQITYLSDDSPAALSHYSTALGNQVRTTHDPEELCASPDVQAVIVASPDVYHAAHAILALRHDKFVFVEKPLALTKLDALAVKEAESKSKGRVTFGYTSRFAAPLADAVSEIGGPDEVMYARLREPIVNVLQKPPSDAYQKFSDISASELEEREKIDWEMTQQALLKEDHAVRVTSASSRMWKSLSGSHSYHLSAMRTALGLPLKVPDSYSGATSWSILFQYPTFALSFEASVDDIPEVDPDIELHGEKKIVRVRYDRSSVDDLSIQLDVLEHKCGVDVERVERKAYDHPFTSEMKKLWELTVSQSPGESVIGEALGDLEVSLMVMSHFPGTGP